MDASFREYGAERKYNEPAKGLSSLKKAQKPESLRSNRRKKLLEKLISYFDSGYKIMMWYRATA